MGMVMSCVFRYHNATLCKWVERSKGKIFLFYRVCIRVIDYISSYMHWSSIITKDLVWRLCFSKKSPQKTLIGTTQHSD